jgi:hypothetical protein
MVASFAASRRLKLPSKILRVIGAGGLFLALANAIIALTLHAIHWAFPDLPLWDLKSGVSLILGGISFAVLQFAVPRTRTEFFVGINISVAFTCWGIEQFLSNRLLALIIDDTVALLFILDLGIVVWGLLRQSNHRPV